mmetsp:Transcript_31644/g.94670  ORF Transcript_31644/g.94670 Transcript_31644/m.94670 type:complete len:171 (+) Transcript_31644:396-908(+)
MLEIYRTLLPHNSLPYSISCISHPESGRAEIDTPALNLAIEVIGSHEELQRDLRLDGEFGYPPRRVAVFDLVVHVSDDLLQYVPGDVREADEVLLGLLELTLEHGLHGLGPGDGDPLLEEDFVSLGADQLYIDVLGFVVAHGLWRAEVPIFSNVESMCGLKLPDETISID